MNTDPKKLTENLSNEQLIKVQKYREIHKRLRLLKSQMSDMQDETHDLIDELDKMRVKENKNKDNG